MPIQTPKTRDEAVTQVTQALIARSEHRNMVGTEIVHLRTLYNRIKDNPALLAEFSQIVKEGALSFAMMGFVPVMSVQVDLEHLTLSIEVEDVSSSK